MAFYYQSVPYQRMFTLVQSANHVLALTGASPTTIISKAGASFIYSDVAAVEVATGWYRLPMTTTTTNTVGDLAFHVTAASADDRDWVDQVLAGVQVATIIQSVKDDLVNQIWATAVRSVTSVSSPVGVASVYDKGNYTLSTTAVAAVSDGWLDRDMSTGVDSGSTTVRTPRQALRFLRNKWSISGTTLTVTKENDSTTTWTSELATTTSTAGISSSDPAGP